jgi:hypothetical protein
VTREKLHDVIDRVFESDMGAAQQARSLRAA